MADTADTLDRSGPQPPADVPPTGEVAVLASVQGVLANDTTVRVARGMSLFGEHAAGWLAIGVLGAALDRPRRREWLGSAAAVAFAHGASIGSSASSGAADPTTPRSGSWWAPRAG